MAEVQSMIYLFQKSMSPDQNARQEAEAMLIQRAWDPIDTSIAPISQPDRLFVKDNIINLIIQSDQKLRPIFANVLASVISTEFPANWPNLVENINANFLAAVQNRETIDFNGVHAACCCLWEVVSFYRFKQKEKRLPLEELIKTSFPILLNVASGLISSTDPSAAVILHKIFKIYFASVQYELSTTQQDQTSLVPWGGLFMQMIEKDIPLSLVPEDLDEREKHPWWKAKKWAYHSIFHLFARYALQSQDVKYKDFSLSFLQNFAPSILDVYLKQVALCSQGTWFSKRVKQQISLFLTDAIKQKNLWLIIKPHLESIVINYIFPQLCVSELDLEEWESDPVEYIQRQLDPMEDFRSSVYAAQGLLTSLVKNRFKQTFMPIITFVNGILDTYNNTPVEQRNPRQKDGAIHLISCISRDILSKKSPIKDQIEFFLSVNVIPELQSPFPFLRVRACDVLIKFELIPTSENIFKNPININFVFESLLLCLGDSNLPVRVWGALALRDFLQYDSIREGLKPHVPNIMQVLLNLTNEIDMDTLGEPMESIAATYPKELAPYAVQLGSQLRDSFLRIISDIDLDDDSDENLDEQADKTMAAVGIMKTISTLVVSLDSSKEILRELEIAVAPVIFTTLSNLILDLYDDAFEIIDSFTFCMKEITPVMWSFFPLIYKAFKSDAIDFLEEMLPSLENFLTYGRDQFIVNDDYKTMIFDIAQSTFQNDLGESDYVRACQLIESFLLNLLGSVDKYIPLIIDMILIQLNKFHLFKTTSFKVHSVEVIINCLYYNPILTLQILESRIATQIFFQLWFQQLDHFIRVHDKKLTIFALCKVIALRKENLPVSIQQGWMVLFDSCLRMFGGLKEAEEERVRVTGMYEGDDAGVGYVEGEDDDEDDDEDYEEVENVEGSDEAYLKFLAKKENGDFDFDENEEDDFEGIDGLDEDPYFTTVLDQMEPYSIFKNCMTLNLEAEELQAVVHGLSEERRAVMKRCFEEVDVINAKKVADAEAAVTQNGTI